MVSDYDLPYGHDCEQQVLILVLMEYGLWPDW